jgi:phage shock protein PspC (stress-responsive transcriptional regulator)
MNGRKIFRSIDDYMIAGVCSGLADYFKIDSSLIRIIFVLLTLSGGSGILVYLILWLVVPKEKGVEKEINKEEKLDEFIEDVKGKAKSMAKEIKIDTKIKKMGKNINILGIVLILVGLVAIWNQIFPIRIEWNLFWPGLLILVGILILFKK